MADASTFVKIDRNILKWRWYKDETTFRLFIHLIINANITDCDFEKITVHRGQLVTSYTHLAYGLGVSVKQIRTALNHLKETGEVAVSSGPKYSVITVLNYDKYQSKGQTNGQSKGRQGAGEGQAKGRQGATIKEYKESEEIKNEKNERNNADAFEEFAQNDVMLLEALRSFEEMRKQIKKPLSDRAKVLLLNKLQTFPYQQWVDIINQSIMNSWQGLFPLEKEKSGKDRNGLYTLSNGVKTNNGFLDYLDKELSNESDRNSADIIVS